MPNHVTSIVTLHGTKEAVNEIYGFIANPKADDPDQRLFDFNKVLPMPEPLSDVPAPSNTECLDYVAALVCYRPLRTDVQVKLIDDVEADPKKKAKYLSLAKAITANVADYGYANWYDWRCDNWGTKWNCYEVERLEGDSISFQTAWTPPIGIMKALSEHFPDVAFELAYADEDVFHNCGHLLFVGGEITESNIPNGGTREAYDVVCEVWPEMSELYAWSEGEGKIVSLGDDD